MASVNWTIWQRDDGAFAQVVYDDVTLTISKFHIVVPVGSSPVTVSGTVCGSAVNSRVVQPGSDISLPVSSNKITQRILARNGQSALLLPNTPVLGFVS